MEKNYFLTTDRFTSDHIITETPSRFGTGMVTATIYKGSKDQMAVIANKVTSPHLRSKGHSQTLTRSILAGLIEEGYPGLQGNMKPFIYSPETCTLMNNPNGYASMRSRWGIESVEANSEIIPIIHVPFNIIPERDVRNNIISVRISLASIPNNFDLGPYDLDTFEAELRTFIVDPTQRYEEVFSVYTEEVRDYILKHRSY